jgi:hypothetical protein
MTWLGSVFANDDDAEAHRAMNETSTRAIDMARRSVARGGGAV